MRRMLVSRTSPSKSAHQDFSSFQEAKRERGRKAGVTWDAIVSGHHGVMGDSVMSSSVDGGALGGGNIDLGTLVGLGSHTIENEMRMNLVQMLREHYPPPFDDYRG